MKPRKNHILDASGIPLGRLATQVATLLIGKRKPDYQPRIDGGDAVKVVNIRKVALTGKKSEKRLSYHHSMYPGGLKTDTISSIIAKDPGRLLTMAVSRMLPKNRTRAARLRRLKVE